MHSMKQKPLQSEGTALKFLADNHKAPPTGLWFGGETPGQKRLSRGSNFRGPDSSK